MGRFSTHGPSPTPNAQPEEQTPLPGSTKKQIETRIVNFQRFLVEGPRHSENQIARKRYTPIVARVSEDQRCFFAVFEVRRTPQDQFIR